MYTREVLNPHHFLTSCIVLNLQYDAVSASKQKKAIAHESLKLNNCFNDSEKTFRSDAWDTEHDTLYIQCPPWQARFTSICFNFQVPAFV